MYCSNCGKEIDSAAKFCPNCGAQNASTKDFAVPAPANQNKCPRCNSTNLQMQTQTVKRSPILGFVLLFGGLGLMILSVIGALVGMLIGWVIGTIIKSLMSTQRETVAVCQDCGYTSKPIPQGLAKDSGHPLFCTAEESNLIISRKHSSCGSAVGLQITIGDTAPFVLSDGMTVHLNLDTKIHKILYTQLQGLGKKNRTGSFTVQLAAGDKKHVCLLFTQSGISVTSEV